MFEAAQLLCKAGNLQADRTLFKQCFQLCLNATNQEALPDEQMLALQLNIAIALAIVTVVFRVNISVTEAEKRQFYFACIVFICYCGDGTAIAVCCCSSWRHEIYFMLSADDTLA